MKAIVALFLGTLVATASALEIPRIFSDHMVLQQQEPVRIWGKAKPNAAVEVQFAGQETSATADGQGNWTATLSPLEASFEGRDLTVESGDSTVTFKDVLVGEVWLGSGQSNMQWTIDKSVDRDILALGANDPNLRLHRIAVQPSRKMEFTSNSKWEVDSPASATNFSAVAYQFAQDLRRTLNVPVGIIASAVGGTPSIAWTRGKKIAEVPQLEAIDEKWESDLARHGELMAEWEKEYAAWREQKGVTQVDIDRHVRQGAPRQPETADSPRRPASLANGMISPIAGYTLRGVIWYQGEQDANQVGNPEMYDERLSAMIADWRDWWGNQSLPFGIVQLPGFQKPQDKPCNAPWAKLRESQRRVARDDPHTGLVVTLHLGEGNDIHPPDKFPVARRLARWALSDVYEKIELCGGPEIISARKGVGNIILTFSETGSGLHLHDTEKLDGFTASDTDVEPEIWWQTNFYAVNAEIVSDKEVKITIPHGKNPIRVRYAWESNPTEANLTNRERLPASPFEIDVKP